VPAISVDGQSGNNFAVVSGVPKALSEADHYTLAVVTDEQAFHLSRCDRFLLLVCHWTYLLGVDDSIMNYTDLCLQRSQLRT
jgi:hypothetical protein